MLSCFLQDETATLDLGRMLSQGCPARAVIFLQGNLGAGKTTLVRGLLRGLGYTGAVKSPTFTLVEPYQLGNRTVYHFDLYRLSDAEELEYMGARDYFREPAVCLIEWSERGAGWLAAPDLVIRLDYVDDSRQAQISGPLEATLASFLPNCRRQAEN